MDIFSRFSELIRQPLSLLSLLFVQCGMNWLFFILFSLHHQGSFTWHVIHLGMCFWFQILLMTSNDVNV